MEAEQHPEKLADRYDVIEIIGSGGIGTVYRAIDPLLNKEVAVKVLKHNSDGTTAARLQREAIAAGKLNHPHICRIDNFGQTQDGSPYMVMEYLDGCDLASKIKNEGALDLLSALEIAIQICGALSYAHKNGIVHRDLKPANVLLLNSKNDGIFTKLLDFGVASLESKKGDLTEAGAIVGSPLYMSPEQVRGEDAKPVSDIYSFGCMLFETLTGSPPLKGDSVIETLALHKNAEAPLLSDYGDFPPPLVSLVKECLSKESTDRPQNASEILSRLEAIQQEILNPKEESKSSSEAEAALAAQRKKVMTIASIFVGTIFVAGLGFIIKDIYSRKFIPETKALNKCAFEGIPDVYFGDTKDPNSLFTPEGDQSHGVRLRAIPDVTDDDMKVLKGKRFSRLCMDGTPINGSGLQYIVDSGVESLSLEITRINDKNTHYLSKMKRLRSISITSDELTDEGIKPISNARQFTLIEIGSKNITDAGIAQFKNLDNITFLHLQGSKLTVNCLMNLGKLPKLKTLILDKIAIHGDLASRLAKFPNLFTLSITSPSVLEPESIRSVSRTNIHSIHIFNTRLNEAQFKAITDNPNLKALTFFNTEFDGEYFSNLAHMKSLYNLNLHSMKKISNQSINEICKIKNLTHIEFARSDVNQENLMALLHHPSLQYLNFHACILVNNDMTDAFRKEYKSRWGHDVQVYF
ncbi:MAG: serine/threonine-protein kinase [Candidatus Melainabacteria bacterium]|nr:serine/threonine-protein kinase [Candidatus Melainabacteria bacterium]